MLELADLDRKIAKDVYREVFPDLEIRLGACQRAALAAGAPVVVVFEGWDAAGKGTIINRLTQALDPRGFKVHPISAPNEEERLRPWMWRFWQRMPPAGTFAIFDRSWYGRVLLERMDRRVPKREWQGACEDIREFERQLTLSGAILVKFWLHIGKAEQKRRFKRLERDPVTAWKVGKEERRQHSRYKAWTTAVEEMLQETSTAGAPWTVVEATQARYVRVKVFETIADAVQGELDRRRRRPKARPRPMPAPKRSATRRKTILDRLDLTASLAREEYETRLAALQEKIFRLEHEVFVARVPVAIVYEGCDAGGKGGNIKRLTQGLDPRGYEVVPVAAPTDEEKARHYLWRFWRHAPKAGHITIFDRSWYGRVLVERVEGFCFEEEWKRAYREINEFERQLADFGTVIVKFWLQISRDEQLRRFRARARIAHKRWKITEEDWRNRRKWSRYEVAVVDMLRRTSTTHAPWTILEANCKLHARVKALETVAEAIGRGLKKK
jgi:polyphosphate kinase 2 (PPK2 family)